MTHELELRDLRYFEAIAELGHLGLAAERLHLTQPALTRCVRRLEEAFGIELFERVGRGIRLTQAGEELLSRARRLHVAADETTRAMQDFAHGDSGHISIGIVPTASLFLLPPVCRALMQEAPHITLRTVIGQDDVLVASLKSGELDVVISLGVRSDDQLVAQTIADDTMVVAASSGHELFQKNKRPRIEDLLDYRWVLAAPSVESRRWLDSAFDVRGLARPVAQIETNLVLLLPPLLMQTALLSFISKRHLAPTGVGSALREVPVKETTMRRSFKVIHRKDAYLSPATQRLIALVRKGGKKLIDEA
jgi:DNA-binding transcriptional LysR family regulator